MPLMLLALLAVWLLVALAAVALCAYARQADEELARAELVPVIELSSAA